MRAHRFRTRLAPSLSRGTPVVGELVGVVDLEVRKLSDKQQDQDRDADLDPTDGAIHGYIWPIEIKSKELA